jgi:hypothetical protein
MKTRFFAVCTKEIRRYNKISFHKGHVYMPEIKGDEISITGDSDDCLEIFPKDYFKEYFVIIFPVMPEDFLK